MKNTHDLLYRLGAAAEGEERAYLGDVSLLLKEAADEIERLTSAINSIRDEASNLLNCHIETPNLARDAMRRVRVFIDDITGQK